MTENLMDGLQRELERNRELLKQYEAIPAGGFGAMVIRNVIKQAEDAIANQDIIAMMKAYQDLRGME